VLPFKGESRLRDVVKIRRVERPDVGLDALVLLVAGLAIAGDVAVDAPFGRDPLGNRYMAGQAAGGLDRLPIGMALRAVGLSFEGAVGPGKRTGRRELRLDLLPGRADQGESKQAAEAGGQGQ
jgi:hypothetical protein